MTLPMACVVVIACALALMLPAITITKDAAENSAGIELQEIQQSAESQSEESSEASSAAASKTSADEAADEEEPADGGDSAEDSEEIAPKPEQEDGASEETADDGADGEDASEAASEADDPDETAKSDNPKSGASVGKDDAADEGEEEADDPSKSKAGEGKALVTREIIATGKTYGITVTYDSEAGIPDGAELIVAEILPSDADYDDYLAQLNDELGDASGYVRLFDICIMDGHKKIQPSESVKVQITLADADELSKDVQAVHFADEDQLEVLDASLKGETVSFSAEGFSVYAIVDAPEPVGVADAVKDCDELAESVAANPDEAFYLSVTRGQATNKYFINTLNSASCFELSDDNPLGASKWYFEPTDNANEYFIYTITADGKRYVKNTSGNLAGLVETGGTVFEISEATDGLFYFKVKDENKWLQYSNGGGGIRFYTDKNNAGNSRITITYASSLDVNDDPYGLDGMTYGIAYHNDSSTSAALMAESQVVGSQQRLAAIDMLMRPDVLDNDGVLLVAEGSDIQEWTFELIEKDMYHISTTVDGTKMYLAIDGGNVTLTDDPSSTSTVIKAVPGTGANSGKWSFSVNGYSLNLPGNASNGFNASTGTGATTWMNIVKKSTLTDDDFTLYTARKVSVSDDENVYDKVVDGERKQSQVVIYTRVWNDTKKRYEFYAVDHDGSLVYCYDAGDNVEWIGSVVNTALWEFTEYHNSDGSPNYYYELRNVQYGNYLAPQLKDGQTMSDDTIGINLNGRQYNRSYTPIIAWDDYNYEYAGLKVEDGHIVSCLASEADDFYFAIVNPPEPEDPADDELTTVKTIDSAQYGITMTMVDFNNPVEGERDSWQKAFMGTYNGTGLLSTNLGDDGYPVGTAKAGSEGEGESLATLFYGGHSEVQQDVNHLFLESIYNESGYFEYDSTQNFAHLNDDGTFTVYDQLGAITGNSEHKNTREHGQFMPYNEITAGEYAIDSSGNVITNQTDVLAQELPDTDARKGEKLYALGDSTEVDYFFGMEMTASFTQTASGLDAWGHDIIFEFSGDDDFWLYVDGELVLDLGGVHSAQVGSVNFRTGVITSSNGNSTLYETFKKNYQDRGMSEDEIAQRLGEIFVLNDEGNYVFTDYSNHTMKMFYMERGAGASNLHMRFNLAAVEPGAFILSKKLSGADEASNDLIEFPYQVYYKTTADLEHSPYRLLSEKTGDDYNVLYEGTTTPVKFAESFTPRGGNTYENVFFLKAGESAQVRLPDDVVEYYVVECGVKPAVYDHVYANEDELSGEPAPAGGDRSDYATSAASLEARQKVDFDNHVAPGAMRTLSITKKLYDSDGTTVIAYPDDTTPFTFRLYLGDENADADDLPLANLYEYHVKNPNGEYCYWDVAEQQFCSLGETDYSQLTDDQKRSATFSTSMNGSISKIPVDHTVEVRNLVVGTQYKVEERNWEIPRGYTRRDADGYVRVDDGQEVASREPMNGTIEVKQGSDLEDDRIEVRNQIGWGLTVKKVWTDKDFMDSHDPIYFAVYLDGELVEGTVQPLAAGETEIYYFFKDLYDDQGQAHYFSDFVVREVTVDDETGAVNPIEPDGRLVIGGVPTGGDHQEGYEYTVKYAVGEATGHNENVRTDTVTNSRPGIEIYKTDMDGNPLRSAVFTLVDSEGHNVSLDSYTSDADGLVTIAYLPMGEFTLEETAAPQSFVGISHPLTITVGEGNHVVVHGDEGLYEVSTENPDMIATITVKNRATELMLRKIDAANGHGLKDVHFALYPQVTDIFGNKKKDFRPLTGYEDLKTGENGVLAEIVMGLGPGTYYLEETETLPNYDRLPGDLCFTIGANGTVTIETEGRTGWLSEQTDPETGMVSYVITIPNGEMNKVRFIKVDQLDAEKVLPGALFDMEYFTVDAEGNPTTVRYTLASGEGTFTAVDEDGNPVESLPAGTYTITENTAPNGYELMAGTMTLTVPESYTESSITYIQPDNHGGEPQDAQLVTDDPDSAPYYLVAITNTPGVELPYAGGPGTALFYIIGVLLAAAAFVYLVGRWRMRIGWKGYGGES